MKTAPCRYVYDNGDVCGESWHTKSYHKPIVRKAMQTHTPINRGTKYLNKHGAVHRKWRNTRQAWLKQNPYPIHNCHYCNRSITTSEMELDHKESRTRRPDLRFEFSNLVPSCHTCNSNKGSKSHDEIPHFCNM